MKKDTLAVIKIILMFLYFLLLQKSSFSSIMESVAKNQWTLHLAKALLLKSFDQFTWIPQGLKSPRNKLRPTKQTQ